MILYSANDDGVYVSTDGATTWKATSLMADSNQMYFARDVEIDPSTPSTVYAGTVNGVMKSTDGGNTWVDVNNGRPQGAEVDQLAIDPVNPQTLYALANPPFYSTDGGGHWTQGQWTFPLADPGQYGTWMIIDPSIHTTIWLVTDLGLLVSQDAGATWKAPGTDLPYYGVQRMAGGSDGSIYSIANNFGSPSAFVLKLDPTGLNIVYCTYLGGSGIDAGQSIAVDGAGRAYVTGITSSFDFPTANALQPHTAGFLDVFISVLDPSGSGLAWSTYLGGSDDDAPSAIAVDPAGGAHVTGDTFSTNFPLVNASQQRVSSAFVSKLKSDGSAFIFSTYLGGSAGNAPSAVAADSAGNTYVAGVTASTDFPTLNPLQASLAGMWNAFVASWNGETGALNYSTYLGGNGTDGAEGVAADSGGNAYIVGSTTSPNFPVKYPYQYIIGGAENAFLAKIAPASGPSIALGGVTNAASYGTVLSPGEIFSIFGTAMAITPASVSGAPLPVKLSDVTVAVNGMAAPLFYASPNQINAQIPFETQSGQAQIQVSSSAGTATLNATVASTAPAIFTLNSQGDGAGAIEHSLTGELVTSANPAAAGEIVSVYCTGLGAVNPPAVTGAAAPIPPPQTVLPVQAYIADTPAHVTYAGLGPGFAGLYQVNVQIPASTSSGNQSLQIATGGASSNTVIVAIH
jgi:uncharacterized protein (TIGR03437 family)